MKRIIVFVLVLYLFAFPVCATVTQGNITLDYAENLTVCTQSSIPSVDGKIFGMNEADFKKYLTENNILLYGFDNDNAFVFELTGEKTDFTQKVGDFGNIKESDIKDFADKTVENPYSVKKTAESVFVVTDSISEEENGYVTRQYITVKNQSLYVVTFIVPGIAINQNKSERIDKIINALSFGESNAPKQVSAVSVIVVAALVIIIVLIAVYIAVTVIRDLRKVKNFENQAEE